MNTKMKKNGFTLIELLVVVVVIGILFATVLVELESSKSKSRDAKRKADLKQMQTSVEQYKDDKDEYPKTTTWFGVCSNFGSKSTTGSDGYIPNLAPFYISILPVDPKVKNDPERCYLYLSLDGKDYKILAHKTVEVDEDTNNDSVFVLPSNPFYDPSRPTQNTWQVSTANYLYSY